MRESEQSNLTKEACEQYVSDNIFKLRPENYKDKYPLWPGSVGLEVEAFPFVDRGPGKHPGLVPLQGRQDTLASCLRSLADKRDWKVEEVSGPESTGPLLMRVLMEPGDALTFEPGGQLEFSSIPYPCLGDAVERTRSVQQDLKEVFSSGDTQLLQIGFNPFHSVEDVGLQMPKKRYQAMDAHFQDIGPWGQKMMRLSCTQQVCVDFGPHEMIMAQRFLLSQLLSPFATAVFCSSPFAEGRPTRHRSYRSMAWRHLDPSRTGIPKGLARLHESASKSACVEVYLESLLNSSVVFVEALDYERPKRPMTFGEWLDNPIDGISPTTTDLETQLSLMFPEVRPRNFLELRSVDCLAEVWQTVPSAFYTGILYDDENLIKATELLLPYLGRLDELLLLAADGLENSELYSVSKQLNEMAISGFGRLPPCFRSNGSLQRFERFHETFTVSGRTPADDLLDAYAEAEKRGTGNILDLQLITRVHDRWESLIS